MHNRRSTQHNGPTLDTQDGFNIIDCQACGFRHLDPIPSTEELDRYYTKQYYQSHKPTVIEEDQQEVEHRNIAFDERLDFFEQNSTGRSILDVGCGAGLFLKRAQERGWNCTGVEPSDHASEVACQMGLNVINGSVETFRQHNMDRYDVVHLKNVLEHVPNPVDILDTCQKLLLPGGLIYIEVPNDYNLFQRLGCTILRERKSWITVPDHINYFNFPSLTKLVSENGFTVLSRDTTFPMYLCLCLGKNFIKDPQQGKKLHQWRVSMELFCKRKGLNFARRCVYRLLARLGLGRTVILYCQTDR